MIFVPANKALSFDAWRNRKKQSDVAPYWSLWILHFQLEVVYFYGGLAKIDQDWLRGEPMRSWLTERPDFPLIGIYFREEWMVSLFAYGALFVDLLAVPFLLWKKTRLPMFLILVAFHTLNSMLFTIGIFPLFMILATLVFFDPSWPRKLVKRKHKKTRSEYLKLVTSLTKNQKIIVALLLVFVVVQLAVPFRHFLYPGHILSWHMKLRDKATYEIVFYATNPETGETAEVNPLFDLTEKQTLKMSKRPDMILQYAYYLAEDIKQREGFDDVEIQVKALITFNDREPRSLVDPNVDLSKQPRNLLPKSWIMPLEQ